MLTGDFNAQIGEISFDDFLFQHELKSRSNKLTCYKNPDKPSCINFILRISPISFYNNNCLFTGLSDCHKLVLSVVMKKIFINNFMVSCTELVDNYSSFENVFIDVPDRHSLIKKL